MNQSTQPIEAFLTAATAFCDLLEADLPPSQRTFLELAHGRVSQLYVAALQLPDVSPTDTEVPTASDGLVWNELYAKLGDYLGWLRYYQDTFNPTQLMADDTVMSDLADDLADIYGDIIDGVRYMQSRAEKADVDAAYDWKFNFWTHWGQHANGALRAFYWHLSPLNDKPAPLS